MLCPHPKFIDASISQAKLALQNGEVPVGAVVVYDGEIISVAHNEVEMRNDATAHAEVLAIQRASEVLSNWRLTNCTLYVTLEPCTMCAGAIRASRISRVVYGVSDPQRGAFGSLYDLSQDTRLGSVPDVFAGVQENECKQLLDVFFSKIRG
ncbi:MAG: nucleoside deaminase [Deltaproteobacteria bacterium]|nr:nucleoside deaminase [Deltaproteobacteria bacterium]